MSLDRPSRFFHRAIALCAAPLLIAIATAATAKEGAANSVRQAFSQYRAALLKQDGEAAVEVLSQPTVDYYGTMQHLAVCGSAEEIKRQSFIDRMQVLLMRVRVPADDLLAMSGREMLIYAIEQGWIGRSDVVSASVGEVSITGGTAVGQHVVQGQPSQAKFHFVNEAGVWKLDLLPTIEASGQAMSIVAKQQGRPENELLGQLMTLVTQKQLKTADWQPILPSAPQCQ